MTQPLPARPDLQWLKEAAKQRLAQLREVDPAQRLYQAQLDVARDHGFSSWRALKARVDQIREAQRHKPEPHLPPPEAIDGWPAFTKENPFRILVSSCLAGLPVMVDGTACGPWPHITAIMALPNVRAISFCPETYSFGSPRAMPDIHGGVGQDVLDGKARVYADTGEDWTDGMIAGAREMLRMAQEHRADLAILMDISAACGSQVIYRGPRATSPHQRGQGVAAALLLRHGIKVVSQRDYRTLNRIRRKLDPAYVSKDDAIDHHEIDWYREYFGTA